MPLLSDNVGGVVDKVKPRKHTGKPLLRLTKAGKDVSFAVDACSDCPARVILYYLLPRPSGCRCVFEGGGRGSDQLRVPETNETIINREPCAFGAAADRDVFNFDRHMLGLWVT